MAQIKRNPSLPFIEIKTGTDPEFSIRRHAHEELSMGFVENGSSQIFCSAIEFELTVNHAMLFPARTFHLCTPEDKDKFRFLMIYIDPDWFFNEFGFKAHRALPLAVRLTPSQVQMKQHFISQFNAPCDSFTLESETLIFIGAMLFEVFGIKESDKAGPATDNDLAAVKTFLDENFRDPIQLDTLAGQYPKSKFALLRNFKKAYELPPHAYLLNLRVNESKRLLLRGHNVADTAVACGFF